MAQSVIVKNTNKKQGVTLIELLLYMGLFVILVTGVLYSAVYLQSVLQYNTLEYTADEQIYRQLSLLQQHMFGAEKVEFGSSSIKIYGKYGFVEQYILGNVLHMRYIYAGKSEKDIVMYPYLKLEKFIFIQETHHETLFKNSIIWVEVERRDMRGGVKIMKEWLVGGRFSY